MLLVQELGTRDALQHQALPILVSLLQDSSTDVRDAAYKALQAGCRFECCRRAMAEHGGALTQLLQHAQEEAPERATMALDLLNHCLQVNPARKHVTQLAFSAAWMPAVGTSLSLLPISSLGLTLPASMSCYMPHAQTCLDMQRAPSHYSGEPATGAMLLMSYVVVWFVLCYAR